jgi:hypothetical protein
VDLILPLDLRFSEISFFDELIGETAKCKRSFFGLVA